MKRNGILAFIFSFLMVFQNIYTAGVSFELIRTVPAGSYYDNGDGISYQIKILNTGGTDFSGDLEFLIGDLTSTLDGGGTGPIFNNIQNSGTSTGQLTNIGTFTQTGNLDVKGIFIPDGGSVTYNVLATINPDVNGSIDAVAKLLSQGQIVSEKTDSMTRVGYDLEVNKVGPPFYEKGGDITYNITIQNMGTSVVKGLDVSDILDTNGFQSSVITANTTDSQSSAGTYTTQGDLVAKGLYITPGNTVTYTIRGRLKPDFVGTLQNSVDLTARKNTQTVAAAPVPLANYEYAVTKTSLNLGGTYAPGGSSTYKITITNESQTVPITGMSLVDEISKITALSADGSNALAYDSNRIVTIASAEAGSSAGTFNQTGDLNATGISIAPGKSVTYTINSYVRSTIVGEIKNSASVTDRNGNVKNIEDSGIVSQAPEIDIQKTAISSSEYLPGSQIGYTISVRNTGKGIAYGFNIEDEISSIVSNLANVSSGDSSADVSGNPISSWTISAGLSTGSTDSESDLVLNSGQIINQDLNDTGVIIYPGEGIDYNITMTTKSTAIGNITNTATASGKSSSATYVAQPILPVNSPAIKITKTTNQSQYKPGGTIEYLITVNNTDNLKFANNVEIKDFLSQIKALDVYGNTVTAIENWVLSVESQRGSGTAPGSFNYGATNPGSSDLVVVADIAPGGEVVYKLVVKVKDEIVGKIFDNVPGDNVTELGTGVSMAPYKLELSKDVDQTEYTPGQPLVYTVEVENTGAGTAVNIPVKDIFSSIKTDLVTGVKGDAYNGTSVTAEIYNSDGSISTSGPDSAGFTGTLLNKDLDVKATISPGKKIIYTIVATVNPFASGRITNTANVNSVLVSDKGSISNQVRVDSSKSVDKGSYPNNIDSGGVMARDEKIVYTIVVSNEQVSGFAMNIPVVDNISQITAELLSGGTKPVFKPGWEIAVKTEGVGTQVSGNPVENGKDINTRVNIAPGGKVTFTVTGIVDNTATDVFYGSITNSATVDGIISKATTNPKLPFLKINKSSLSNSYVSGGILDYSIEVTNEGDGYANNAQIKDALSSVVDGAGNKAFSSWKITGAQAFGTGTTVGTVTDNQNIDAIVDIAPNGGKVVYTVEAQLNDNLTGIIANTASVLDVQNNNTSTASASTDNAQEDGTIFIRKTSNSPVINPESPFTYEISVKNNSVNMIKDISIRDNLNEIKGQLANSGGADITDITGNVFTSWKIYKGGTLISTGDNDVLQDLITTLAPQQEVKYEIVAQTDPRVLIQKVRNTAEVYNGNNLIETSYIENNVSGSTGGIQRSVNLTRYVPGDQLVYTIKIAPNGSGYLNNFKIDEEINSLNVGLMNGSTGNVFFNPNTGRNEFTVQFVPGESKVSQGTIPIPSADVRDNENLIGTVDVAQKDYLVYKITGTIRPDILGSINYKGLITNPYRQNLSLSKQVVGGNYDPGKSLTYILTVQNKSLGNAGQIPLQDILSTIQVESSKGGFVPAFKPQSITVKSSTQGYGAVAPAPSDPENIDVLIDVPVGGFIKYEVTGVVDDTAVGGIVNKLIVDGDTVSTGVNAPRDKLGVEKKMERYLDVDGVTGVAEGYVPGGYVEYSIDLSNEGDGIIDDYQIIDEFSKVQTTFVDGTEGPAFTSWEIVAEKDSGVATDIGTLNPTGDINTKIDIGPNGYIKYKIIAKIDPKAVGSFANQVSVNGVVRVTENSKMASPVIVHTKKVYDSTGSREITTYKPGDQIVYKISIKNVGLGTSYGVTYEDLLKNIVASEAGNTSSVNPFGNSWKIVSTTSGDITTIGTTPIQDNNDIRSSDMVISQRGEITFTISATIGDKIYGVIENSSVYGQDAQRAVLQPVPGVLNFTNKVLTLEGQPFNTSMMYKPGDKVQYELIVENTGDGFLPNVSISDYIPAIASDMSGNTNSSALKNISLNFAQTDPRTSIVARSGDTNLFIQKNIDLAPKSYVRILIDAEIDKKALGQISGNIFVVNNGSKVSEVINPSPSIISGAKDLISPTSKIYIPGDEINYKITVTNSGEGYGNNIPIKDLLPLINTELVGSKTGKAFSSWTVLYNGPTSPTDEYAQYTFLYGQINDKNGLNATIDIGPGVTVTFDVKANVSLNAVGTIENIATIGNKTYKSEAITLKPADLSSITVRKIPKNDKYSPNGPLGFEIGITNSSDTTANDILLTDIISAIQTEQAGGNQGPAFQGGWTVSASILGDTTNSAVIVPSGGDLQNSKIDLAKASSAVISISGNASATSLGVIKNTASWTYNNSQKQEVSAIVNPNVGAIDIVKTANITSYTPGSEFNYLISVTNTGIGYVNDGIIADDLKSIQVDFVDGSRGPAFTNVNVVSQQGSSQNTKFGTIDTSSGYKQEKADIYPGDTVTVRIAATVNPNAFGPIVNSATAQYGGDTKTSSLTLSTEPGILSTLKTVDKLNYTSQGTLNYTVTLTNSGKGWLKDVTTVDEISKITTTTASGQIEPAFSSATDINKTINIAPGTSVELKGSGEVNDFASGEIKNSAIVNGANTNEVISNPLISDLDLKVVADKPEYVVGDGNNPQDIHKITYTITLKNIGQAVANLELEDPLKGITVKDNFGNVIPAFKSWQVLKFEYPTGDNLSLNVPINTETTTDPLVKGALEVNGVITLVVECIINETGDKAPVGDIINTPTLKQGNKTNSSTVTVVPSPGVLELTKVASAKTYKPGDEITYTITLKNTGDGFLLNNTLVDNIENIVTELAGDAVGQAFESWTWTVDSSSTRTILTSSDFKANQALNTNVTLAPKSQVTITVKAIVSKFTLGDIPANVVTYGSTSAQSEIIKALPGVYNIEKTIVSGVPFVPKGDIVYEIKVANTGDGYVNDLKVADKISGILADSVGGTKAPAFSSWIVSAKASPDTAIIFGEKNYPNTTDIDDVLDISPGATAIFTVVATVADNIYGDIENIATAGTKTVNVTAQGTKASLDFTKTPVTSTYSPGGPLGYLLQIDNTSSAIAGRVKLKDYITSLLVDTVGNPEFPFKNYTIKTTITGDTVNTNMTIPTSGDIDIVGDIGPNTSVKILIEGTAIDTAIGKVENSATLTYLNDITKTAVVEPNIGALLIEKTAVQSAYTPGQNVTYNIRVTNTGAGYTSGVAIKDDLKSLAAFNLSNIKTTTTTDSSLSEVESISVVDGLLTATANIHPNGWVNIQIDAEVLDTIKDPINNTALATYNGVDYDSTNSLNSVPGNLSIEKFQNKNIYVPQDELIYTLELNNTGNGWLKEVALYDDVKNIQTQVLGGGTGSAFIPGSIRSKITSQTGKSTLQITQDGNLVVKGDMAPQSKAIITITGTVADNAVGAIKNTARAVQDKVIYNSQEVIAIQENPVLKLLKTANTPNYEVGKPIEYTVSVENNTINNISGVSLKDVISGVKVLNSKGVLVNAFKPGWKISYSAGNPGTIITSGTVKDGEDLDVQMDIHSFDKIKFTIEATVIDDAVGPIKNIANAKDSLKDYSSSYESLPYDAVISSKKVAVEQKYSPGSVLTYNIDVENTGRGYADNIPVSDILSTIMVMTPTGEQNAFDLKDVKISIKAISAGVVTTIPSGVAGVDLSDSLDMPPNSSITYEITGIVNEFATGNIENTAIINGVQNTANVGSEDYTLKVTANQNRIVYIPGEDVEFNLNIENVGLGLAVDVDVKEYILEVLARDVSGNIIQPFESWVVIPTTVGNQSTSGKTEPNKSIDTKIDIAPKGNVNYLVRARVKAPMSGDILIDSIVTDSRVTTTRANETFKNVFKFIPPEPIIEVSKTSDKENYIETDEFIIYTLTIKNSGVGNVEGVEIKDIISELKGKNGNPLFTEWKTNVVENGESANADLKIPDNKDIIGKVNLRSDGKNEIVYTVIGKINKGLDDDITNVFMARDPITSKVVEASVTNHVKKIPDNEGELRVIKKAFKNEVKIGEAVEYEIIVENNNESRFIDVVLKDRIPSGFKYVKNTTEITMSGLDGVFKTNDDEILTGEPVVGSNGLSFPKFSMEPFTKYRVRYLLKPSVGVTFGKYVNSAYVDLNGSRISNIAHATVSIQADALLDTASIIGKVFEDKNGDGYQDKGEFGIPGVRLITPKGIVIETDQFGRYHVPDEWVYSKNGKNYEVKLDDTTLPKDMEVLSENPQIRRISPYALTKFNFSVRYKDGKERVDKTRIYVDKGAIWGVVDSTHVEPELMLTIPKEIVVKNGAIAENVNFTVRTNYGDFIKKYELQIFAQEDNTLSHPIMILSGDELYNDMDIDWNGQLLEKKLLKVGQQLRFRLKVFSADGKFDTTKVGYTDLVSRKPEVELFNYENETEVGLQIQNIGINTGMVRFTGDGLKDVEKIYIGNDEYDVDQDRFMVSKYMPSANYMIPVKLVYEDNSEKMYELEMNVPETYYIQTGIADFSLGRNYISGNSEVLDVENPFGPEYYADNIYNEGRIAYYGRGKYKDKWRLTVQVDTKANSVDRLFNDILKRDEQTLFERVEDSENVYYPTYGDRAYIYNDAPTDGKIYLKLQYEKSSVMWGNYNTGFTGSKYTQYNRSLYGAKGSYISSETTEFGDEKNTLIGFASEPDSLYGHDEFLGTGGSLYFLKNGDVLNGSEKIWIKVVDSNTGLTSKIIYLEEGKDYEFDPYQGRIILAKPLSGNMSGASNGIIQNSVGGDNYVYLIADYEYIPKNSESINETDYGFKGRTWMNDHVGVGGTYIKESKDRTDYTLSGVDLTLKATEGTYFKGEVSRSEGVQTDNNFVSYDGGLTFDKVGSGIDKISGNAYNFTGVLNLADLNPELFSPYGNDVRAWYEKKEKGYSFASELGDKEFESYGAEINLRNTDRINSKIKYESMEERDLDNRLTGWIKSIGAQIEYLFTDRVVGGLAIQHVEELRDSNVGTGDLLGARVEYEIDDDTKVFTEGQVTLNKSDGYDKNDIITVGGEKKVTEKLTVDGKTSVGTRGNYTEVGADYNLMEDYDVYLGYSMDGEEDSNKITAGQRAKVTDKISIYQENQFLNESEGKGSTESYGVDYELDEDISFGASFQLGKIDLPDDEGTSKRRAFSIYSKVETAKLTLKNKLEYREEENEDKIKQYLTTNSFNYVIDEEYTFAGKLNFAFTDDEYNSKFIESSIGLAYRPIYNDRLNFLSRYTVILDDDPRNDEDSRAYVVEFESIYSYTKRLDLGLKGAYRRERDQYVRESGDSLTVNNNIYLVGLKANYMVMNDWEVYGQYHWLVDQEESDVASGAIVGIYKNMHKNLKFGGGYNFSGFSDNLGVDDYKAHGWFVNVIGRM
ncbi:hypothetical protein [Cetobacterium sp.]|uniref:hypothetical protein n=1 Tax=Cetobacterium sp. TaxID=2071632 RepID=UPI002FC9D6FB